MCRVQGSGFRVPFHFLFDCPGARLPPSTVCQNFRSTDVSGLRRTMDVRHHLEVINGLIRRGFDSVFWSVYAVFLAKFGECMHPHLWGCRLS